MFRFHLLVPVLLLVGFSTPVWSAKDRICISGDPDSRLHAEPHTIRFATFNAYLNRFNSGDLIADLMAADDQLEGDDTADVQIRAVAEIIQRVRPDVLLLNEFDYDENGTGIELFQRNFLGQGQNGKRPIHYPYVYSQPSNTGIPSGLDLDNDGSANGPGDAYGFGFFPGQYGMVLLSKYPINERASRTFQHFLWRDMPGNLIPEGYYIEEELDQFRLSSKSHWDAVLRIGQRRVHVLAAHPTPPVFDGEEDRNGTRNHDEIRFWADYIRPGRTSRYIYDDNGQRGGLNRREPFVIMGDYNADPYDGDSTNLAISQLLDHPRVDDRKPPASFGGVEDAALEGELNADHVGNPAFDTGDFNPAGPGNLRVDYVLPSKRHTVIVCGGVYWPQTNDDTRYLVGDGFPVVSSDHHLVWQDIRLKGR